MSILKRRSFANQRTKEIPQIRCPSHLAWVRGHVCALDAKNRRDCLGKIQAAHVRIGTDGGMGVKPSDSFAIPLCDHHHAEQHAIGEQSFERKYGISMLKIANDLWRQSPHGKRWRMEQGR